MAIETGYKVTITATLSADLTDLQFLADLQNSLKAAQNNIVQARAVSFYDARIVPYTKRGKASGEK